MATAQDILNQVTGSNAYLGASLAGSGLPVPEVPSPPSGFSGGGLFGNPGFSLPSLPNLPQAPTLPGIPAIPPLPDLFGTNNQNSKPFSLWDTSTWWTGNQFITIVLGLIVLTAGIFALTRGEIFGQIGGIFHDAVGAGSTERGITGHTNQTHHIRF